MNFTVAHFNRQRPHAASQAGLTSRMSSIESLPKMFPYCSHAESNNGRGNLERPETPENYQNSHSVNQSFINHVTMKVGL